MTPKVDMHTLRPLRLNLKIWRANITLSDNSVFQGLFWSQACIWLIYPEKRIPHLKNEAMNSTSAYPFLYTDYLPTEFLINGIVSACLTVVNVICIFITAIIVLKIKEVSAPYTASPDLKR